MRLSTAGAQGRSVVTPDQGPKAIEQGRSAGITGQGHRTKAIGQKFWAL